MIGDPEGNWQGRVRGGYDQDIFCMCLHNENKLSFYLFTIIYLFGFLETGFLFATALAVLELSL